tara:strand:+ start:334 stop:564 length:231 start_codon:yes stop_codon:yes gene_type:complete
MNSTPNYYRVTCNGTYVVDIVGHNSDDAERQLFEQLASLGFHDVYVNWENKKFNVKEMTIEPWINDTTPPLPTKTQ